MTGDAGARRLLALPLLANNSGATTVRGYLIALLSTLWRQEGCFSGKAPFGDSGWQYDLYEPMVRAGFLAGGYDRHGELDVDTAKADELIQRAIAELGRSS